jgi:DNA modification methylase
MGSGTTAEAAYTSNRNYIGSEIMTIYYEISLTRLDRLERQGKLLV